MEKNNYFDSLTGFRALAASMVLIGHLAINMDLGNFWYIKYGWTGVNLFFTLSGFLFTYLYFDKFANHTQSIREYVLKRVIRIYPLVFFLIFVTVISHPHFSIPDILAHITLLHSYIRDYRFSINPPMWTLTVEESFYFFVPVMMVILYSLWNIHWFKTVKGKIILISIVLVFVSFGFMNIATQIINLTYYFTGIWDSGFITATIFGRFYDFGIGIITGLIFLKLPNSRIFTNKVISNLLFVLGASLWLGAAYWVETHHGVKFATSQKLYQYFFYLYSTGASIMLLSLVGNSIANKVLSWQPIVYLGKVSFALYLVQFMEFGPWKNISLSIKSEFLYLTGNNWLSVFATFFVIFLLSSAVYHGVEMPSQKFLKKKFLK